MRKLKIVGASHWVNRMFEACGNYQWAREFLKNSLEAQASKIEFGIEWQAVEKQGIYRRTVCDDGSGMSSADLLRFFSTLGEGAKRIGGLHDNFGVGAKIASLPWNPDGVVVISYKDGQAAMIKIVLEPESAEYELVEFKSEQHIGYVVDPTKVDWGDDVNWGLVAPEWVRAHGTAVILLGSEEHPDTVLGNPRVGEHGIKGLSVYLNTRFWDLRPADVRVVELRSEKKNSWPLGPDDKDDSRRPNNRQVLGAKFYLNEVKASAGKLGSSGTALLDQDRVMADWYLWEGERPAVDSYAKKQGYIAVRYKDELFQLTTVKAHFRWFGVVESKVQQNLTIILEPDLFDRQNGHWGVHVDGSRNRLIFSGAGEKGVELPLSDWGLEFAEHMPDEIKDAIHQARGEISGSIEDDEYRRRLQDKFGSRWRVRQLVKAEKAEQDAKPAIAEAETVGISDATQHEGLPGVKRTRRKNPKTVQVVRMRATDGSVTQGVEREVPVDVPNYRFGTKDEFDRAWHLAVWAPHDPDGPTVVVNRDSPILQEAIRYHREQYPDVYADEVARVVEQVYGEVAVCKIAHSQKLKALIPVEDLDQTYRSEAALTVALMGLLAEESVIAQRLGRLGRKKPAA